MQDFNIMKQCFKCSKTKEFSEFHIHKDTSDGYSCYCKECKNEYQRIYRVNNKERVRKSEKKYANKESSKKQSYARANKRYREDIQYNLSVKLRRRFKIIIRKGFKKYSSAVKDLGCSLPEFKDYLESKFTKDMTWEDFNKGKIHIDHIIPLSRFDLTNREEQLKAVHYTNLQPLWAIDNLIKQNK